MNTKTFRAAVIIKSEDAGEVEAMFSVFGNIDSDGDIVEPSFFEDGQSAPISAWGHRWGELPVGRGVVDVREKGAVLDGRFFMDTVAGREHFLTVKNMAELQEWSFGFEILESEMVDHDGERIRLLTKGRLLEVSPVLIGANRETETLTIKGDELKPFPTEHACRLRSPSDFEPDSFRRVSRRSGGKKYGIILGKLKGEATMTSQAFRYPIAEWDVAEARAHCKAHDGQRFEPASGKQGDDDDPEHGQEDCPRCGAPAGQPHATPCDQQEADDDWQRRAQLDVALAEHGVETTE